MWDISLDSFEHHSSGKIIVSCTVRDDLSQTVATPKLTVGVLADEEELKYILRRTLDFYKNNDISSLPIGLLLSNVYTETDLAPE